MNTFQSSDAVQQVVATKKPCNVALRSTIVLRRAAILVLGLAVGCVMNHVMHRHQCEDLALQPKSVRSAASMERGVDRKRVLIGVMTARSFLDNRAVAQFASWGQDIPGDIMFFSSEGSTSKYDIPVIPLRGVDDAYPPQKKSFVMLKYMHDHFLNDYEWFMRADDDAYIKGDRLEKFLCSLNSSIAQHIGQPGFGRPDEVGKLGIDQDYAYCMGGPGVIMSRKTLSMVGPHVAYCLQNLYSWHEDSEVGRCIYQYAGASCTKAYDIKRFLYHQYDYKQERKDAFPYSLSGDEVDDSISLHPIKSPPLLYRLHAHVQGLTALHKRERVKKLHEELQSTRLALRALTEPTLLTAVVSDEKSPLADYQPVEKGEAVEWEFISYGSIFSHRHGNPKRGAENDMKDLLRNANAYVLNKTKGNFFYKQGKYSYVRANPLVGIDVALDLVPDLSKLKGKRPPQRKQVYARVPFTHLEAREIVHDTNFSPLDEYNGGSSLIGILKKSLADMSYLSSIPGQFSPETQTVVNILIPLYKKYDVLVRFMENFVNACLRRSEPVSLLFILYESDESEKTLTFINQTIEAQPTAAIRIIRAEGDFSRGRSLNLGAAMYNDNDLLYFLDIDIYFSSEHLERIRRNTIMNEQVYYPIFFHQYDNELVCKRSVCDPNDFSDDAGFFRAYSYGMISIYKGDFTRIGGFDNSIEGWGLEDVELCEKIIKSNLSLFRTVDPNFTHIYHYRDCEESLKKTNKYDMCVLSRAGGYMSERFLSDYVYSLLASRQPVPITMPNPATVQKGVTVFDASLLRSTPKGVARQPTLKWSNAVKGTAKSASATPKAASKINVTTKTNKVTKATKAATISAAA